MNVFVKGENVGFDRFEFPAIQKRGFIELVVESRQGTKQGWNRACHILGVVLVFLGEPREMEFEPHSCLILDRLP